MASQGRPPPLKPYERVQGSNNAGSSIFAPSAPTTSTAEAVASSATNNDNGTTDKPTGNHLANVRNVPVTDATQGRPMALRPWEHNNTGYNRPYYSYGNSYGNSYGGYSGMYGTNYGNNYGFGGGSMYNRYGGGYGGYNGYGPMGGSYNGYGPMGSGYNGYGPPGNPGNPDPNDPYGPPRAPSFWRSMLTVLSGVLNFFGRLAILIDENTQAFHFFITALLQLCDRAGLLYGELARFVLRLLGFRTRATKGRSVAGSKAIEAAHNEGKEIQPAMGKDGEWNNLWPNGVSQ